MKLETATHYRARKARAVRFGDKEAADQADIGLRAVRLAKAIRLATEDRPPLPPEVIDTLRNLLSPAGR